MSSNSLPGCSTVIANRYVDCLTSVGAHLKLVYTTSMALIKHVLAVPLGVGRNAVYFSA